MKQDKYREARGGWSRIYKITCNNCSAFVCFYQKDGPGPLKRMYYDRVIKEHKFSDKFLCPKCETLLGDGIIYEKEDRPAYHLIEGAITKKLVKSSELGL